MNFDFDSAAAALTPRLGGGTKWSLEPTRHLLDQLGNPHEHYASIHIAGTNGKGSVAAMVASVLRHAGYRVGLYTSPHLVDLRERVTVDGEPITGDAFASWTNILWNLIEAQNASFFETYTAIAFADFAARGAEVAVVETGLGARLDSTNVLSPLASVITNVDRDHSEYLGDNILNIAWEKAHVGKAGIPLVIGETRPDLLERILGVAREIGAMPIVIEAAERYRGPLGLRGAHQARNAAIAVAAVRAAGLDTDDRALQDGIANARLPGRLDRRGRWVFDVAHNEAALMALKDWISAETLARPLHLMLGMLKDKPADLALQSLAACVDKVLLVDPPSAPGSRRWTPAGFRDRWPRNCSYEPDFDRALADVPQGAGTIVVAGSFHTVGDAMARLPGFKPLG